MMNTWEISEFTPPIVGETFFGRKTKKLWGVGDPALLKHPLLGIISARQIDSNLASKTAQLLKPLVSLKDVAFVSGWHSPLEEEALRILLAHEATVVLCVAKSLDRFIPSMGVESRLTDGKALLLTHCSTKAKRITRSASMRRNELIVELAKILLVLSAPAGSASLSLAKSVMRRGKPVVTLEHPMNRELLASGALPATLDNVHPILR